MSILFYPEACLHARELALTMFTPKPITKINQIIVGVCTLCNLPLREPLNERVNMGTQNN